MMGAKQEAQAALFYEFSLEDHVPFDHLLRLIDRFVDLGEIRAHLAPHYSSTGRPSVDPALMIRMLLVGYIMGIRSERRLCEEVHLNLAYRWFCRLDLTDAVPDHSTFSKNRHGRFRESDLFRHLFEDVLSRCIAEGLVGGSRFGADASLIKADASRYAKVERADWSVPETVTRATQEYLTLSTTRHSAHPRRLNPRRFRRPIRPPAIQALTATGPSLPIRRIISSISTMPSSLMWLLQRRSGRPRPG